ncbi:MAG TPA: replication factor C large subunit [Candidatus Nanoarchaeia archaeon]|nr:replication factor C large subunit [Candidatus Nanoarchaeia archaeon]
MKNQETFAEKYRIQKTSELINQEKIVEELKKFLAEFPKKKAALLYGSAGTGKTSLIHAFAKENNLDILELNSSDLRNRKKLEEILKPASLQQSLFKKSKIILMDEVDGVTGSDIGGIPELVRVIEETKFPICMTCNDAWQSKLSPVRAKAKMLELKPLDRISLATLLKKVAEKEGIQKQDIFYMNLASKAGGDVRAALNDLQSYFSGDLSIDITEKRDQEDTIFNILRRIFKERGDFRNLFDTTSLSLDEILLWIEENIPKEYKNEALVKAYSALSKADVFRGRIYRQQFWRFLVYQNIFQSAGISFAKKLPQSGFTKYERPKRVLKIWMNNQRIVNKKTIAKKYASLVHCSVKRAMRDFELLRPIINSKPEIQKELKLSDEELAYLNKPITPQPLRADA